MSLKHFIKITPLDSETFGILYWDIRNFIDVYNILLLKMP